AARSMQASRAKPPATKLALVATGSILIGLGISLYIHARLGLPPYDVLLSSIVTHTGLSHGQAGWAVSGSLLLLAGLLGRRPSVYGLVFVVTNGASIDVWSHLLVDPIGLGTRILFVILGIIAVAGGIAVVAHSSATGGPFELLTGAAQDRGVNPTMFRSGLEMATVGLGIALGGQLGFGTLAFVVTIGPAISFIVQALADRQTGRDHRLDASRADHHLSNS
ncbi:MAG: hypothetical protein GY939_02035, partial [Actinomycetia bacterium]|nr:hypothetical protein [Actinomycetes bacterium]